MRKISRKIKVSIISLMIVVLLTGSTIFSSFGIADEQSNLKNVNLEANEKSLDGFHLHQLTEEGMEEIAVASFPIQYDTKTFEIASTAEELILQIDHTGLPYAGIEQLQLTADGNIIDPWYACFADTGKNILNGLLYNDLNVVVGYQHPIEIGWDLKQIQTNTFTLSMTANEYPEGTPIRWEGGQYELGSNFGSILVDGR